MRIRSKIVGALLTLLASPSIPPATAQQPTTRIGGLEIRYDPSQWQIAVPNADVVVLSPTGLIAGKHDAVRISRRKGDTIDACASDAREQWAASLYHEPQPSTVTTSGREWRRLVSHTRCRNATPNGVMLCTAHEGDLYTLTVLNRISACRNVESVLFPDPSLLDGLMAGLSFSP